MIGFKKARLGLKKGIMLLGLMLFPLIGSALDSTHLIRIDATAPFPTTVATSSTTTATYTVVNTSPNIALAGIQDQSSLPSGMTILNTSTCKPNIILPINDSCTISMQLVAGATATTLSATLKEHALPSADAVQLPITVVVGGAAPTQYTITSSAGANGTIAPNGATTVNSGDSLSFIATPALNYSVQTWTVDGSAVQTGGATHTLTNITANHTVAVTFYNTTIQTVPSAPTNVVATGGNASATISWSAPTNYNGPGVTGYTIISTVGSHTCTPSPATATVCTVTGLTNGAGYTFTVSATNSIGTGPLGYSSPVTPQAVLSASPSNLALALSGASRTITVRNNSGSPVTLSGSITPTPILPEGTIITSNTCTNGAVLSANGGTCTITIQPGPSVTFGADSAFCTTGIPPIPSVISVTDSTNSVDANVVVLGYACRYQSGYVFAIDDTTPSTSSIGGKVAATADQANQNTTYWSGPTDSIWGIDDASTVASPSPNTTSEQPAILTTGQLNCNAINDGFCATNNLVIFYSSVTSTSANYAFSQCKQAISGLTDWYLPSTCELGPFGATGQSAGSYPYKVNPPACPSSTMNIQARLAANSIGATGSYWSSTQYSIYPPNAWYQSLASDGGFQNAFGKNTFRFGVRCVRALTL